MSSESRRRLEPASTAAAAGRRFVEDTLEAWGLSSVSDDALLVTSELVANATVHTELPFELRVIRLPHGVRIEVTDASPEPAAPRATPPLEPGGLGLLLVDRIARAWGSERLPDGKTVWAELDA